MTAISTCPQCGQPVKGGLCAGVCPQCMASSMLGEWDEESAVEAVPEEFILTRVADYDVLRVLGRGGMGVVCRARDRLLGREVALKLMHSGVLASDEELRRFRIEAETVARLRHPNLVTIHEAGEADGQAFYTMNLAEGGTLAQKLQDGGPMQPHEAAELVACLANAVHHAHSRGVLHRDLKPANVVFDAEGTPMVSDFGLARFTADDSVTVSGSLVGTPGYLAPEVANGTAGHTTSSDVYALGVILYECLTGRPPFENDSPLALLKMISEQEPAAPSSLAKGVNRDLEAVCLRALNKDPNRRYSSAEAFADDLARWLRNEPVTARLSPVTERFWRWSQRHQSRAVLYTMTAVSLVILVVASAVMNLLLSSAQARTEESMRRSEMRRAELLRDFAAYLMMSKNTLGDAAAYLREAASVGTGRPLQDHAIRLRVRVLDRLAGNDQPPLPVWKGGGLKQVWFDHDGHLFLQTDAHILSLSDKGAEPAPASAEPPSAPSDPPANITADDKNLVHIWTKEPGDKEVIEPLLHPARVTAIALSVDSRYLATLAEDHMLRVWEVATRLPITPPIPIADPLSRITWDGYRHQIAVWNSAEAALFDW